MKKEFLLVVLLSILMLGCNQQIKIDDYVKEVNQNVGKSVAEQYISNLLVQEKLLSANNRSVSVTDLELFEDIEIVDENGNVNFYTDLTEEEKVLFVNDWYNETVKQLQEKINKDKSIEEMLSVENQAFAITISEVNRSVLSCSAEAFVKSYSKNLSKLVKKIDNTRSSKGKAEITSDTPMNEYSLELLHSKWKKGRILVCKDTSSSSSSFYLGHASMMYNEWNSDMEKNPLYKATFTSSPLNDKITHWEGKIDGVQEEPIGYWAGLGEGCAEKISILNIRSSKKVDGEWVYTPATDVDYLKAAEEINDYEGTPYGLPLNKNKTKKIYCSQLCYLAWLDVDDKYKLGSGVYVKPADLISSRNTTVEISLNNTYSCAEDYE